METPVFIKEILFWIFYSEGICSSRVLDKGGEIPAWYVTEQLQATDYMRIKLDLALREGMKLYKARKRNHIYRLAGDH